MKRLLNCVILGIIWCQLFARSQKAEEYMEKARKYESEKCWVYAMGSYLDAFFEDDYHGLEAMDSFTRISEAIEKGNPGLGKYNAFTSYEGWNKLLIEAERYWNEYVPFTIKLCDPVMGTPDMKTRTADVKIPVAAYYSEKYRKIMDPILKGYKKVYTEDWTEMPPAPKSEDFYNGKRFQVKSTYELTSGRKYINYWPVVSAVYYSKKIITDKMVEGSYDQLYEIDYNLDNYNTNDIGVFAMNASNRRYDDFGTKEFMNPFAIGYGSDFTENLPLLYEFELSFVDKEGNVINKTDYEVLKEYYNPNYKNFVPYEQYISCFGVFKNMSIDQITMIEERELTPVVSGVRRVYGFISSRSEYDYECNSSDYTPKIKKHPYLKRADLKLEALNVVPPSLYEKQMYAFDFYKALQEVKSSKVETVEYNNGKNYEVLISDSNLSDYYFANVYSYVNNLSPCFDEYGREIEGNGYRLLTVENKYGKTYVIMGRELNEENQEAEPINKSAQDYINSIIYNLKVLLNNAEGNDKKKLESIAKDITALQKMLVQAE